MQTRFTCPHTPPSTNPHAGDRALDLASLTVVDGANHAGDELLMVPFSESETGPSEGSSKRHKRQVDIGNWEPGTEEQRRWSQDSFSSAPRAPAPPFLDSVSPSSQTLAPFTLSHRRVHHGQHTLQAFTMEFWGEAQFLWNNPKPHLPRTTLLSPQRQNGFDRRSGQSCCGCRAGKRS